MKLAEQPIVETVSTIEETFCGKKQTVIVRRMKGLRQVKSLTGEMVWVDEVIEHDAGKYGVSRTLIEHIDREVTEEERAANRAALQRAAAQAMVNMGIW